MTDEIQLGDVYRDRISGYEGIVINVVDHITGCRRIGIRANDVERTSRRGDEEYFYEDQLSEIDNTDGITDQDPITEVDVELGQRVVDGITGFEGIVTSIGFELYNCPRIAVQSVDDSDVTESGDCGWIDAPRLSVVDDGVIDDFDDLVSSEVTSETGAPTTDFETPGGVSTDSRQRTDDDFGRKSDGL